jgi:hypothetical protein
VVLNFFNHRYAFNINDSQRTRFESCGKEHSIRVT